MTQLTDRNLLAGLLAVQLDFVSREQLIAALNDPGFEQDKPLERIFFESGVLPRVTMKLLQAVVAKHLQIHDNRADHSLRSLQAVDDLRQELRSDNGVDGQASGTLVPQASGVQGEPSTSEMDATKRASATSPCGHSSSAVRYEVIRLHATGGIGQVFVAQGSELKRRVALKELQDQFLDNADIHRRFVREAELTGALEHPGIVPVYGLGQYSDGRPFYAMRFIPGDSLEVAVRQFHGSSNSDFASLRFRSLLSRFVTVCQTIEYAHSQRVLHCDLKPRNIMLGKYGETLVVDWGAAKSLSEHSRCATAHGPTLVPTRHGKMESTHSGSVIGTPGYMSPEHAAGRVDELGCATDIYSLGGTLYYLLTAENLVATPTLDHDRSRRRLTDVDTREQDTQVDILPPRAIAPKTPRSLEAICLKAMALRPGDRYASAAELAADVERYLADEPVSAMSEPFRVRASRWIRRRQTFVGVIVAAVTVASIALGMLSMIVSDKNETLRTANLQLESARDAAVARRKEAEANADVAREQSKLAIHALSVSLFEAQRRLANIGGTAEIRRRMLTDVLQQLGEVSTRFISKHTVDQCTMMTLIDLADTIQRFQSSLVNLQFARDVRDERGPPSAVVTAEELCHRALMIGKQLVEADPLDPQRHLDLAKAYVALGDSQLKLGRTQQARKQYQEALRILQNQAKNAPQDVALRCLLSSSIEKTGMTEERLGKTDLALERYRELFALQQGLAADDPTDKQARRDLALAHRRLGDVYLILGPTHLARAEHEASLRTYDLLAQEAGPDDIEAQRLLSISYADMGNVLQTCGRTPNAYVCCQKSHEICGKILAADPSNIPLQRQFAKSLEQLGNLSLASDRRDEALAIQRECLKIRSSLADADPQDVQLQRDLSTSHICLGEVYLRLDRTDEALLSFEQAHSIRSSLADADPGDARKQRNLSLACERLGDVHSARVQLHDALAHYQECFRI